MNEIRVRPMRTDDATVARELVAAQFEGTRYAARICEQIATTIDGRDDEYRGLTALSDGGIPCGVVLFGAVTGARGTCKVHAIVARNRGTVHSLAESVRRHPVAQQARLIFCEIADDSCFAMTRAALMDTGFVSEGSVPDWFAPGVALLLLVQRAGVTDTGADGIAAAVDPP